MIVKCSGCKKVYVCFYRFLCDKKRNMVTRRKVARCAVCFERDVIKEQKRKRVG